MGKVGGTRYNSLWDGSTWSILGFVVICCLWPCFLGIGIWPAIISLLMPVLVLLAFIGTYYKIDGDKLVVYSFFIPTIYPIDKIKEIKPTKSILSSPATSLTQRLAITFVDRGILKSSNPLIISPVHQDEFIRHLQSINPEIRYNL